MKSDDGKRCPDCGEWKSWAEFHRNRSNADGHQSYCKPCWNARSEASRQRHIDARQATARERERRRRAENPAYQREAGKRWYAGKGRDYYKRYRVEHPEVNERARRKWQAKEHNSSNAYRRRRAAKVGNGGSHTEAQWQTLAASYDFCCAACGKRPSGVWPDVLCRDHVVPLALGGTDDISNIQPLCNLCNVTKGNRHSTDYRKSG